MRRRWFQEAKRLGEIKLTGSMDGYVARNSPTRTRTRRCSRNAALPWIAWTRRRINVLDEPTCPIELEGTIYIWWHDSYLYGTRREDGFYFQDLPETAFGPRKGFWPVGQKPGLWPVAGRTGPLYVHRYDGLYART